MESENIKSEKVPIIDFDIREYMDYQRIRSMLIHYPTELSLFEISCILINNKIKEKNINDK
jgi:hypothetical protein